MNNVTQSSVSALVSPLIGQDEFVVAFNPLKISFNGDNMVQSYPKAVRLAKDKGLSDSHVWTIVEGEDESLYAKAGYHIAFSLGYVVTEKPWISGTEEALWYECEEVEDEVW